MYDYEMPEFLPMLFVIVTIILFVLAIGLWVVLIFLRRPRKDIYLFSIDDRQELTEGMADYFTYIKYDADKNAIVLKQSQVFKKCVVTLIATTKEGKVIMKKYNLVYAPGDLFAAIQLQGSIDKYKVILESIDGSIKKHSPIDNFQVLNIIYASVVSVVFIMCVIVYVYMWSFSVHDYDMGEYGIKYALAALSLIYFAVTFGGYFLSEMLSKKGAL